MKQFLQTTLAAASIGLSSATATSSSASTAPTGDVYASGFDMTQSWGNLNSYKDAPGFGLPKGVPQGCELSQVHVLHRHAQRYPTDYPLDGEGMVDFSQKVANYSKAHEGASVGSGPMAFLSRWTYALGTDLLLETGASTEATAGANFWNKYGRLLYRAGNNVAGWDEDLNTFVNGTERPKPVFRTTSQARILESARWWLSGFFGNSGANSSYEQYDLVEIPEEWEFNNTLASYDSCLGAAYEGDATDAEFIPRYTKNAVSRLSPYFPRDFNLTASDILAMQNLCVYEYTSFGGSFFCSLFTEQEWKDFEYNIDIQYYGDYAYGSATGRAQGIGYVVELAARLQHKLLYTSDTSVNYTYTNNLKDFPLDQPFYMDMSHDDIILSVITALGLDYFNFGPHGLPGNVDHAPKRNFSTSQMTPFGARLMSEIWTCPSNVSFEQLDPVLYQNPDYSCSNTTTDYIRFVLNGAPLPTEGLVGCEGAKNGFCAVKDFLSGVPQLVEDAQYQYACFGNYSTAHQVGNGAPLS